MGIDTTLNIAAITVTLLAFVLAVLGRPLEHRNRGQRVLLAVSAVILIGILTVVVESAHRTQQEVLEKLWQLTLQFLDAEDREDFLYDLANQTFGSRSELKN